MDKYEYKLKLEQMQNLVAVKDYKTAAQIADSINWKKVKSVSTLCMVGEIYEHTKQLDESREILLMAYDRSPVGRNIIYRLTLVAVKLRSFEEAEEYYEEFLEIAPHDNMKYVLKYEIAKGKGAGLVELIDILEEFKEREYTEEWAFELAYLYHKAGNGDKCVEICDELILWFGEGRYVEKALELKMLYQPLNKLQEDKYRRFKQKRDGFVEVHPTDALASGEIVAESMQIPDIQPSAGRFNTLNLQAELAKSMQQIMNATEQETVADTMDSIKKMVEEIPYLKVPAEQMEGGYTEGIGHTDGQDPDAALQLDFNQIREEDYNQDMTPPVDLGLERQITGKMSIDEVLTEWERTKRAAEEAMAAAEQQKLESAKARALQEAEGIMDRLADVIPKLDAGVTPQELMTEHYLNEGVLNTMDDSLPMESGDSMETFPDLEVREAMEAFGESDEVGAMGLYEEALEQEPNMMYPETEEENLAIYAESGEENSAVYPETEEENLAIYAESGEENSAVYPETEEENLTMYSGSEEQQSMETFPEKNVREPIDSFTPPEEEWAPEFEEKTLEEAAREWMNQITRPIPNPVPGGQTKPMPDLSAIEEPAQNGSLWEERVNGEPEAVMWEEPQGGQMSEIGMTENYQQKVQQGYTGPDEYQDVPLPEIALPDEPVEEPLMEMNLPFGYGEAPLPEIAMPDLDGTDFVEAALEKSAREEAPITGLNEEQKEIFSYFMRVSGMEQQLCQALQGAIQRKKNSVTSATGNIIVIGGRGSGKTMLATDMVKVIQKTKKKSGGKVGKITASVLNQKDISKLFRAVEGGYLIIEKAGALSNDSVVRLSLLMEGNTRGLLVILEDTRAGIEKVLSRNSDFAKKFTEKVKIPIFTSDELVSFARAYAREQECEIDDMGILALYNCISNIQKVDEATTLTEVKEIMDLAIERAKRGGLLKLFGGKRHTEDGYILLKEKDFEK